MAGNTVYVQGSYVDVHDNEVVNLSIDKATVSVAADGEQIVNTKEAAVTSGAEEPQEELFKFIHPTMDDGQERQIHVQIKRLVARQGIQEICQYLNQLADEKKILLPQNAEKVYNELVRMGMPDGEGYTLKTFRNCYRR